MNTWFKINSIAYGWFEVQIGTIYMDASDYLGYDMPQKLLDKVYNIVTGNAAEEWLYFMDEPGANLLHITSKDGRVFFREYGSDKYSSDLSEDESLEGKSVIGYHYEIAVDMQDVVDNLVAEFSLYEKGNGRTLYKKHWGAFPERSYHKLKELAFQMGKKADQYHKLFCVTYLEK